MDEYIDKEEAIEAAKHAWAKGLEPKQYIDVIPAANDVLYTPTPSCSFKAEEGET